MHVEADTKYVIRVKMTIDDIKTLDPGVAGEGFVGTTWGDKAAIT